LPILWDDKQFEKKKVFEGGISIIDAKQHTISVMIMPR